MARQLAERHRITGIYADVVEMLEAVRPDAVHVTTPPQSHYAIAGLCLRAGSNVYLEKPFTVSAQEAESLIERAEVRKLTLTAGHNYQFTPEMLEMRRLVQDGFLGGRAVHLESHWSYDLSDMSYVGPFVGNPSHWVRQLPGQLFHNIISHGIARLAEFLEDVGELTASAHQSAQLGRLGGQEVKDELRVLMRDRHDTTAIFCFSTQIKPGMNRLRVCGPANSITVDLASGSMLRHIGGSHKSYLTFVMPELNEAREQLRNLGRNTMAILRRRLYQDAGMKELIERFYRSITIGGSPPIPYREILLTARLMDAIFNQIRSPRRGHAIEADTD